jgi:GTP-binding protein
VLVAKDFQSSFLWLLHVTWHACSLHTQVPLIPPRLLTLEEAIGYVAADELIEVTPEAVRIRKVEMSADRRRTAARQARSREQ